RRPAVRRAGPYTTLCRSSLCDGVEFGDVDRREAYVGVGEQGLGGGGEVGEAGADMHDEVGLPGENVRGGVAFQPDPTEQFWQALLDCAFAAKGLRDRDTGSGDQRLQLGGRLRVDDPAPRD